MLKIYRKILFRGNGWYIIMEPAKVKRKETTIGQMCIDVFGEGGEEFKKYTFVNVRRNQESNFPFLKVKKPLNCCWTLSACKTLISGGIGGYYSVPWRQAKNADQGILSKEAFQNMLCGRPIWIVFEIHIVMN
jgi:hypothetical protein